MKITGKIISVILAVILLIGMMPMSVFAEGVITYLDDPDVVITTTIDPQPDEEPVASPGFDVKVDNWGGSGTEDIRSPSITASAWRICRYCPRGATASAAFILRWMAISRWRGS